MPTKPPIILLGAGGHCRSCIDVVEQNGRFTIAGIVDRAGASSGDDLFGYRIIGTDDDLASLRRQYQYALVTTGQIQSAAIRVKLFEKLDGLGFQLPSIVSPKAHVSSHATVAGGSIVMHGAIVNAAARIGRNCILNTNSLVEHDATIGDHCHVSTGAIVNGGSSLGAYSFLGSHATMIHGIQTPPHLFFKAGKLVRSGRDGCPMQPLA